MANILITGAAGFIGSHVAQKFLSNGHKVTGLDNFDPFYPRSSKESNLGHLLTHSDFRFVEKDLTDPSCFDDLGLFDVVIHIAAKAGVGPSVRKPESYLFANVVATQNLLEYMRRERIAKLLFASSSSVYGNNQSVPFKESDAVNEPISPYAFTKRSCELLIHTYHHLYQVDALNLRFFTVYGPRQRPDLAIHKFVRLIEQGKPVTMYGDGTTARDYTYIDDTVEGVWRAFHYLMARERVYDIINLGNRHPIKLSDLITAIYKVMGKPQNVERLPMQPGDVQITFASIDKAKKLLGYNPNTGLEEGLAAFIEWYRAERLELERA